MEVEITEVDEHVIVKYTYINKKNEGFIHTADVTVQFHPEYLRDKMTALDFVLAILEAGK